MNKTIYINGRFLTQVMAGVHRYAYEICKAIYASGANAIVICPQKEIKETYNIEGWNVIKYGIGNSHFWEQVVLPTYFFNKKNYVLINFTGLASIFVSNKITTIHDLAFLENPGWYSKLYYNYYRIMTPIAARTSKAIITVSNNSKEEILKYYPFVSNKDIHVIYNACDDKHFVSHNDTLNNNDQYCLAVQSLDPRKNLSVLLKAFEKSEGVKLYLVGGSNAVFSKLKEIAKLNNSDRIIYKGRVTDEELIRLYDNASCFVSSSLFEGFGIPLIEAMNMKCPVVCSDIPVYHEVCKDAAIYFDPHSSDTLSNAIKTLIDNPAQRKELIQKGLERRCVFSWEKSAKEVIELIKKF